MFNNRKTVIPDIVWHEAETGKFFMRTADDHARVYKASGGDAAGRWRAILNDVGLYESEGVSSFTSKEAAMNAVARKYENIIQTKVFQARKVMTFYTEENNA